ncbi:MAG: hypothetical protein OXB99_09035 [Acidimicrobiaceae bacterium]|nr:hypothetical protein [Acidimicrobiaceae bacterium]
MRRIRTATAILVIVAILAIPSVASAGYFKNYWQHKDLWTDAHLGDDTPTWEDEDNDIDYYDLEVNLYDCRTYGGDIDYDDTVALELRRQITAWPDESYGEEFFDCTDEDYHDWIGVDDNGTFFLELDEIMGERSGDEATLDRTFLTISP